MRRSRFWGRVKNSDLCLPFMVHRGAKGSTNRMPVVPMKGLLQIEDQEEKRGLTNWNNKIIVA